MLVTIEGFDGSGKTTVAKRVAEELGFRTLAFPCRSSPTGALIDQYLKGHARLVTDIDAVHGDGAMEPLSNAVMFQALQVVNRLEVLPLLRTAVSGGCDYVLDRYWFSGWVYGQLDGCDRAWLGATHEVMPTPTLSILLDVDPDTALTRQEQRGGFAPEIYEGKRGKAVRGTALYRELWGPRMQPGPTAIVDATQPLDVVVREVVDIVRAQQVESCR